MNKPSLPERLAVALLAEISSGHYRANKRFLSRREIMRQWKVSSPTATQGLRLLEEWGILHARDRSGHHLEPRFLQKALLRINQSRLTPLRGHPQLEHKARALLNQEGTFRRIAVVSVSDVPNPGAGKFYEDMPEMPMALPIRLAAKVIFSEAKEAGVTVHFYYDDGRAETRRIIVREMERSRVQGVIILRRLLADPVRALAQPMLKLGVPVVTAFDDCENLRMVAVNFNNVGLGYTAARRLIDAGHTHIVVALPREEEAPYYYRDRFHGCQLAVKEVGRGMVTVTPVVISIRRAKPMRSATELFDPANPRRATALFATSVNVLMALRPSLDKAGARVPSDVALIMCSSTPTLPPEDELVDIMKLDFGEIGRRSFRALHAMHRGEVTEKAWLVDADYEPHGTVAPPRA